ncbi:MAG: DUF3726 domain-containing protein [Gammaproteobacteria bacterium]|nr:DUF3726 domain-containing protein [Gammaproteobacteria bacterium]
MLSVSQNELQHLLRKALNASGVEPGADDELAKALADEASHGNGTTVLAAVTRQLTDAVNHGEQTLEIDAERHRVITHGVSMLAIGAATADAVCVLFEVYGAADVVIDDIDRPALLLRILNNRRVRVAVDSESSERPDSAATHRTIRLRHAESQTRELPPEAPQRTTLTPDVWSSLERLAARTYVPDTERSRTQGAGANLDDSE